jgi:riboflavin synthase
MFTGIVEKTARVAGVADRSHFRRLTLVADIPDLKLGESIAVNGCCLTVAEVRGFEVEFDVVKETLDRTNLGTLKTGEHVNIERSLKVGDRLDGHFVQGHVDGLAMLVEAARDGDEWRLKLEGPSELAKYIVPKGSVALDGVSLTVASVSGQKFEVALIPTTLAVTTLREKSAGWAFNLETDVLCKTVVSWLEKQSGG